MYNLKKRFIFLGEKFEKKKLGLPRLRLFQKTTLYSITRLRLLQKTTLYSITRLRLLQKTTLRSITRLRLLLKKAANLFGHHCILIPDLQRSIASQLIGNPYIYYIITTKVARTNDIHNINI